MRKNIALLLLLFTLSVFFSCQSKKSRIMDFVERYNTRIAPQFLSGFAQFDEKVVARTYAEFLSSDRRDEPLVKVVFVSKFTLADDQKDFYKQYIPAMFASFLSKDEQANRLLDHGIRFKVIYASRNEHQISEMIIDEAKMNELTSTKSDKNLEVGKNNKNAAIKPEVKDLLITLNNSLPIVIDETLGLKITKIDLNSLNDLVYTVEAGTEMSALLKDPKAKTAMKDELLNDPAILTLYTRIKQLGLSNIKYRYVDPQGNQLTDVSITAADFKK